jgi:hypothetical protein
VDRCPYSVHGLVRIQVKKKGLYIACYIKKNELLPTRAENKYLLGARIASTLSAICQSSNKFGYSAGSARDSAALEFT